MADPAIIASIISGLFTIAAATIAFGPVAFQIRKQGQLNRDAATEAERNKFKSDLYSEGVRAARGLSNAASAFHGFLRAAQVQVEVAYLAHKEGLSPQLPSSRFPDVLRFQKECSDRILEVIFLIEERRILNPKLVIFRDALHVASHDLQLAFGREAQHSLMKAFPTEIAEGQIFPYTVPNDVEMGVFRITIDSMTDALSDLSSYSEDLIVELQNLLLSDVFGHIVAYRIPLDPTRRVIRISDYEELKRWIAATPWGIECARVERETLAIISDQGREN